MAFLPLVGAVVGAASSIAGGIAGANQANYQAAIARRNAVVAGQEQASAIQAGEEKAAETSLAGAVALGGVKAEQAANNVDVNTGSAVNVRGSERMANILNAQTTMWNAARSGWGYAQQAIGQEAQASLDKSEASQAMLGGVLGGVSGLVKGAGDFFSPSLNGNGGTGFLGSATPVASNNFSGSSDASVASAGGGAADVGSYSNWPY